MAVVTYPLSGHFGSRPVAVWCIQDLYARVTRLSLSESKRFACSLRGCSGWVKQSLQEQAEVEKSCQFLRFEGWTCDGAVWHKSESLFYRALRASKFYGLSARDSAGKRWGSTCKRHRSNIDQHRFLFQCKDQTLWQVKEQFNKFKNQKFSSLQRHALLKRRIDCPGFHCHAIESGAGCMFYWWWASQCNNTSSKFPEISL